MSTRLAVIIVNYKTPNLTLDCLESLRDEVTPHIKVVVVDNASPDGSADIIEERIRSAGWSSWACVVRSPVNGGFSAGNNLGIRSIDAEAYVLLNSDTLVVPGALQGLLEGMKARPDAGLIGPTLKCRDGSPHESTFRYPKPIMELARAAQTGALSRLLRLPEPVVRFGNTPGEPEWLGFPCVLVRREVIETIGPMDEGFFMYFEDIDYCRRARDAGWAILYWPKPTIVHLLGQSSDVTPLSTLRRRAPRFFYESRSRYFAKHFGLHGLWLANVLWTAGRGVSLLRELVSTREPQHREAEAHDIWINALHPLARSSMIPDASDESSSPDRPFDRALDASAEHA